MPSGTEIVSPDGGSTSSSKVGTIAASAKSATSKIDSTLKPAWVILALGGSSYLLSETRILGPILSIILAAATIYQLNQYIQARRAGSI